MIIVCGLSDLGSALAHYSPSHLISILPPEERTPKIKSCCNISLLRLTFHDTYHDATPSEDFKRRGPTPEDIKILIDFSERWDSKRPLLIHCKYGRSRSPAAALIVLWNRYLEKEREVANLVRDCLPFAAPNGHMVALADSILNREGRLLNSITLFTHPSPMLNKVYEINIPTEWNSY